MKRIGDLLREHAGESVTLDELATMASKSRSHFERAHHLLVSTPASLTAIAAETGFYALPHCDKAFRQRVGTPPQGFRLRHNGRTP